MLISIIVPVYNAEKYIKVCADSILSQSYKDLELILVDDGSSDKSPEICDEIATKDSRVTVCHQKNSGVSGARNKGIELAKGEYIAFVDNDDLMPAKALEVLAKAVSVKKPLVVQGNVLVRNNYSDLSTDVAMDCSNEIQYCNVNDFVLRSGVSRTDVWGKLYYRKLALKYLFPLGHYGEDLYFNGMVLSDNTVSEIATVNNNVYIHFDNGESASHRWTSEDLVDIIQTVNKLYNEIKNKTDNEEIKKTYYKLVFTQLASHKYSIILKRDYNGEIKRKIKDIRKAILKELPKSGLSLKDKLIYYVLVSSNKLYREYIVRRDPTMKIYEKNVKEQISKK